MPSNIAARACVVTLKAAGKETSEVAYFTGLLVRTINDIYVWVIKRSFDPAKRPLEITDTHIADAPRSGRPKKQTIEIQAAVASKVRCNYYSREKTYADIAGELSLEGINISLITIWQILRGADFKKIKPTRKSGLIKKIQQDRLDWYL